MTLPHTVAGSRWKINRKFLRCRRANNHSPSLTLGTVHRYAQDTPLGSQAIQLVADVIKGLRTFVRL